MFPESEGPCLGYEELARALRLLHSAEPGSAEELLGLYDASIARRYGAGRTTTRARLADTSRKPRVDCAGKRSRELDALENENLMSELLPTRGCLGGRDGLETPGHFTDSSGNDVGGKDEVPRISIPDEGLSASAVCKVCNVPEFGLLILIQCRDCEELYHPLCHQPPVLGVRAHDPDLSWRCSECQAKDVSVTDSFLRNSAWIRSDVIRQYSRKRPKHTVTSNFVKR